MIGHLRNDIEQHGEVHATFEEHDEDVELRKGTVDICDDCNLITVDAASEPIERFGYDSLVSWYMPEDRRH